MSSTETAEGAPGALDRHPKTAVVVIHGMGEQWPMETLRGFVEAAWQTDVDIAPPGRATTYSKPDKITGSFELRRITTMRMSGDSNRRVDFFEFYWQHLMRNNSLADVLLWMVRLFFRSPRRVPHRLRLGWIVGNVMLASFAVLAVAIRLNVLPFVPQPWVLPAFTSFVILFTTVWLRPVVGDAARYLSPSPGNVGTRQAIREAGIDLLAKLHASGDYDRIIVAGHSLGSVVGYDILNYAWARLGRGDLVPAHALGLPAMVALETVEQAAGTLVANAAGSTERADFRVAQRGYFSAIGAAKRVDGSPLWLVSDFVTMGCPLSKADLLIAADKDDLRRLKAKREIPTCPPWLEQRSPPRLSYPMDSRQRIPHHAAVFAPTVWTNIYFPSLFALFGDFIAGPLRGELGRGILDVRVPIGPWRFRHLDYWRAPQRHGNAVRALRRALNLRMLSDHMLWGPEIKRDEVRAEELGERIDPPAILPS